MAEIRNHLWLFRHIRAEASSHVLHFRGGRLVRSGRGLSFWFLPWTASVAEVPVDDRELAFLVHARASDYQEVFVQGVVSWRVVDPERLAERVDFSIDTVRGTWLHEPLDKIASGLVQLAEQHAIEAIARQSIQKTLTGGIEPIRRGISEGLAAEASVAESGILVTAVRVASVKPTADLERALRMPALEAIQQEADQATFARRALAVEKERAIEENELQSRIELATREEALITQRGANDRRRVTDEAEAERIASEGEAGRARLKSAAQADGIRLVEGARVEAERDRLMVYKDLPVPLVYGMAAQELAGKLQRIEHLTISPELLGPLLTNLVRAGTERLEEGR